MTARRAIAVAPAFASLLLLATVPALLAADAAKPAGKNLLKPTNQADNWRLEQHEAGKGAAAVDADAITFEVTTPGVEEWHVQAVQTGFDLSDGKDYVLTFKGKANADRTMTVNVMIDAEDWHNAGLQETANLTKDWQDFKYEFKADQSLKDKNRVSFLLGTEKGKVWLKDVTLTAK